MKKKSGFTLIELSIVLVIIGLIIGGVLYGRDLIAAAVTRKIISEERGYEQAFLAFRLKYNALPGDLATPDKFWPSEDWTRNAGGNGDGIISWSWEGPEAFRQLALAKLISDTFIEDCLADSETAFVNSSANSCRAVPGKTAPRSKVVPMGTWAVGAVRSSAKPIFAQPPVKRAPGTMLVLAKNQMANGQIRLFPNRAVISTITAYQIDSKLDDGMPLQGRIQTGSVSMQRRCVDAAYYFPALNKQTTPYLLSGRIDTSLVDGNANTNYSTSVNCAVYFNMPF
jgi:prepilin-type N-terminal cleavage/methylation domain-containing protein